MQYKNLGITGLKVSRICLGTMMFGDQTEFEEARDIVSDARQAGINFIDTADVYSAGKSEEIVGRLIGEDRQNWVLATKVGNPMEPNAPLSGGLTRRWVHQALRDSLERLGTRWIDVYYLHCPDAETPIMETLSALKELLDAGHIRYWALSNFRAWQIAEAFAAASVLRMPPPVACQPYYNAMNRMPEVEVLPACAHFGIGVVPYSPLARGVLTGKYDLAATAPSDTRAGRGDKRMLESEFRKESMEIAHEIKKYAETKGTTPVAWACAWLLANRTVSSILAGPRTFSQWQGYKEALDYKWTIADEAFLDARVPAGHPSTPGFSDPRYPLTGRSV